MYYYKKIILTIFSIGLLPKIHDPDIATRHGIIVFERHWDFYFIETKETDLAKVYENRDTIKILTLGTPGDNANAIDSYKEYLNKTIVFKTSIYVKNSIDYRGNAIEYNDTLDYKSGYISYAKAAGYKLHKRYDKINFNGKPIIYEVEDFTPMISFEQDTTRK